MSKLGAFDRSKLGAFRRSKLGVRGFGPSATEFSITSVPVGNAPYVEKPADVKSWEDAQTKFVTNQLVATGGLQHGPLIPFGAGFARGLLSRATIGFAQIIVAKSVWDGRTKVTLQKQTGHEPSSLTDYCDVNPAEPLLWVEGVAGFVPVRYLVPALDFDWNHFFDWPRSLTTITAAEWTRGGLTEVELDVTYADAAKTVTLDDKYLVPLNIWAVLDWEFTGGWLWPIELDVSGLAGMSGIGYGTFVLRIY